jgi:hypothetical protein
MRGAGGVHNDVAGSEGQTESSWRIVVVVAGSHAEVDLGGAAEDTFSADARPRVTD